MTHPMTEQEFYDRLKLLYERFNEDVVNLVHEAQDSHGLGIDTDKALNFADSEQIGYLIDYISCLGGWISDRLNGINRLHKKSLTKKIRRALGYIRP